MSSLLANCSDGCGWIAAVFSVLSFGSFGVPIKGITVENVHPLVLQSFKTLVCFVTSFPVVYILNEPLRWTWWGLVSGLFWVPGAACGIYGIRNAGLAIAVGTWSSIIVLTSFVFGIIVFQERVRNFEATCAAFVCLLSGLVGMAKFSAPSSSKDSSTTMASSYTKASSMSATKSVTATGVRKHQLPKRSQSFVDTTDSGSISVSSIHGGSAHKSSVTVSTPNGGSISNITLNNNSTSHITPFEVESLAEIDSAGQDDDNYSDDLTLSLIKEKPINPAQDRIVLFNGALSLTRRQLGVLCAVINGAWGGMNLIPLHFAQEDLGFSGPSYLISYAGGALIVNTFMWIVYFLCNLYSCQGKIDKAIEMLPKWHLKKLLVPGVSAGLLYSMGNFCSILAVSYLGQGTGFSFCQMQLFISGLWGVLWFKEIQGAETIAKWFASAGMAVIGIIWLSYEHESKNAAH